MTLLLGVDIGSTTTKAVLAAVSDSVTIVHVAHHRTPADVDALRAIVDGLVRECAGRAYAPIAAIGIASMAESVAALDGAGRPLTPLLRWDRQVDRHHLETLLARHPDLPRRTGIPATTKPTAVAIAALRAEQPDVFTRSRRWTGMADLAGHMLTGESATDHTLAARTMLARADGEAWEPDVLASLGVAASALPAVRRPGEPVGWTLAGACGLDAGIPVYIAGHDHAVGAWAVGARTPGAVADSLGTAEAVVRVTDVVDRAGAVASGFAVGRTVDGTAATVLGGSPACGAMFAWWDAERPGDRPLDLLGAIAPQEWTASPMIVLPYPSGRQCPAPDPAARVRVVGETPDRGERARGLLQSLVAHARWVRESAERSAGSPSASIAVLGSLAARVPVWAPLVAAAGVPTTAVCVDEPVAAGAALLAGVRAGTVDPDGAVLPCRAVRPAAHAEFDDVHRRYLQAVAAEGGS